MSRTLYFILEIPQSATFGEIMELEALLRKMGARAKRVKIVELSPDEEEDIIKMLEGGK